ncbi:YhcN/YlaJ family sporulation lipoprotein [Gracilibacillus caseinilyticus]|uniref:YhcN/YlaJ family sporulation lipoprotein n=1 Tax=Gracilibacillus caseinilyticus TaxID=2932256 RepID=A0ABY4EWL6_9BACI|nr:YhcN/YlaJ family sporulation lipoprotein [Gracilibacillus caseinilyticus]UOQ48029.1 YhcN/YlaJ family sporulation lipoprotein [Gracilibacillus caseinilyticus]
MKIARYIMIFFTAMLVACNNQEPSAQEDIESDITQISSNTPNSNEINTISTKVKDYLDNQTDDVASYKAIHINDELFVAFTATPFKQAVEQNIEKKLKKELKKITGSKDVFVTSDQKFYIELTKIENEQLTKKEMEKRLEKLKKLAKESA